MPNLICPLQLIGLHTEHPVAYSNVGLDQVQGPGTLFQLFRREAMSFSWVLPQTVWVRAVWIFNAASTLRLHAKTGSYKRLTTGRSPFIS